MVEKLSIIKGIGVKIEKYLNNLGIYKPIDLLYYFPKDYEEYVSPKRITDLEIGKIEVINAVVVTKPVTYKKGNINITYVWLDDGTGRIRAFWFNIPYINKTLIKDKKYIFRGRVAKYKQGFAISQCKIYNETTYNEIKNKLSPIYHLTKGISNLKLKNIINSIVNENIISEYLPQNIIEENNLCDINFALKHIHFPENMNDMLVARKRLVYDEFFLFSLAILLNKNSIKRTNEYKIIKIDNTKLDKIKSKLPYKLTNEQEKTLNEIISDLTSNKKMNRLIEGDVGSGKTIVSFIAAILVVENNFQAAIMAPTEVLAIQHYNNFIKLFDNYKVALLTGSVKKKDRNKILEDLKNGKIDIIIGTHALFSKDVIFKNLALAIIDEQHKFGVGQRKALFDKSKDTHVLVMSATPIPRTLAMLLYADLDISFIREKPKNRLNIKNCIINKSEREKGYKAIKKEIDMGHQAYVICASIEENEENGNFTNYQSVKSYLKILREYFGKNYNIEMLHGKMKADEKNIIMNDFKDGKINILCSTTVIEVGVDVKNATFIMIEDAGSFGLAELHQLRGRVGRGDAQSFALFVDTMCTEESKKRLNVLKNSNDGFYISEEDLKLRGPGDIFGIKQSGDMDFKLADIYTDLPIFRKAGVDAKEFLQNKNNFKNTKIMSKLDEYLKNGYTI